MFSGLVYRLLNIQGVSWKKTVFIEIFHNFFFSPWLGCDWLLESVQPIWGDCTHLLQPITRKGRQYIAKKTIFLEHPVYSPVVLVDSRENYSYKGLKIIIYPEKYFIFTCWFIRSKLKLFQVTMKIKVTFGCSTICRRTSLDIM